MNQQITNNNRNNTRQEQYVNQFHKRTLLAFLTFFFLHPIFAQDVVFTASAPESISIGEGFSVSYTINRNADSIHIKSFDNFQLVSGPQRSCSANTSIINGKVTTSYENSFTYELKPVTKGILKIPTAFVTVKGKEYSSDTLTIKVSDALKKENSDASDTSDVILPDELYIDLAFSKQEVYLQEPIIATLKLYSKYNISTIDNIQLPGCDNFLCYNITDSIISPKTEIIEGNKFTTAVLKKLILYPLTSGSFQVGGGKFSCTIQKPSAPSKTKKSFFDDFFGPPYKTLNRSLKINTQHITIKPLPKKQSADFGYFCGTNINITDSVTSGKIETNSPFSYEITLSGKGNLKFITPPVINLPQDCELVAQRAINHLTCDKDGMAGSRTFQYTILPKEAGKIMIPAQSFSYFDLDAKEYKTVTTNQASVYIEKKRSAPVSSKYNKPLPVITNERTEESNLMIAMDVSGSMLATDLKPNRIESAVNATKKFLLQWKGKAGVVIFSEGSSVKCPMRSDLKVVSDSINSLSKLDLANGTAMGFAICKAILELKKSTATSKAVVLLTDGENNAGSISPKMAATLAGKLGIKLFIIGVSGKDSLADYPYKTPSGMEIIKLPVKIDESLMNEIATITSGKYFRAFDNRSFDEIYKEIRSLIPLKNSPVNYNTTLSQDDAERILNAVSQDIEESKEKVIR